MAGEVAAATFWGPTYMPYSQLPAQLHRNEGKSTCVRNNRSQPGANLLKGSVLNLECYSSFQSGVIKRAYTFQEEARGRLAIIKSLLCLAPVR